MTDQQKYSLFDGFEASRAAIEAMSGQYSFNRY